MGAAGAEGGPGDAGDAPPGSGDVPASTAILTEVSPLFFPGLTSVFPPYLREYPQLLLPGAEKGQHLGGDPCSDPARSGSARHEPTLGVHPTACGYGITVPVTLAGAHPAGCLPSLSPSNMGNSGYTADSL